MLVLPIGGKEESGGDPAYRWFPPDPPVDDLLAAATGIEEHTVPGLTSPKVADLTGDGLADLWGAVDGKLVAIRAEPVEAWRVLDRLHAAGDFDGDRMSDLLSDDFEAPPICPLRPIDRHTALARSSRDGRLLWQTQLDAWEKPVYGLGRTIGCRFMALGLPGGDLDGDGVADFVVRRGWPRRRERPTTRCRWRHSRAARASGSGRQRFRPRWGAEACGAGIEGIDARACDPGGSPDVFLMYPLASPSSGAGADARR